MTSIVQTLKKVVNSGKFASSGKLKGVLPGLCIKDVGEVAFPFIKEQAEKIITKCEQAPFGRGEETIVDTSVRNVWQMSPKYVTFTNPEWDNFIAEACKKIAKELGLSESKIQFELYKVLIYGSGSFFKKHRDTEKMPNMFATMVVNLPSTHEGGELIVSHAGESKEYSFSGESKFYPEYVAFYADCYHEVKPVLSGYRVSLIYNLCIFERQDQPKFSQHLAVSKEIDGYIAQWANNSEASPFLVYLLEHSYTEKNLKLSNLKNKDYAKASVLLKSAEKSGCEAFLCLVSYRRESYGDCWGGGYYGSRDEEIGEGDFEEYDVSEEEIYAHNFLDAKDGGFALEKINLKEKEILAEIPLLEGPGREVHISEATGNEGATKDLWYHRGALILWPKHRSIDVALRGNIAYAIHRMSKLVQQKEFVQAKILANHIMDQNRFYLIDNIRDSLIEIGDYELLNKYLHVESRYGLPNIKAVTVFINSFGLKPFENDIDFLFNKYKDRCSFNHILDWLNEMLLKTENFQEVHPYVNKWTQKLWEKCIAECCHSKGSKNLALLIQILSILNSTTFSDKLISELKNVSASNFLPSVFTPVILKVLNSYRSGKDHSAVLKKFAGAYIRCVGVHYSTAPKKPGTFARKGNIDCKCSFCKQVNDFLPNPDIGKINFEKTLKRNLLHVEDNISHYQLDLEIKIEKIGNKFQGTVVKNQKSFELHMEKYTTVFQGRQKVEAMIDTLDKIEG